MKAAENESQGMEYLQSVPRRWVTLYIPIGIFLFVLGAGRRWRGEDFRVAVATDVVFCLHAFLVLAGPLSTLCCNLSSSGLFLGPFAHRLLGLLHPFATRARLLCHA